MPTISIKYLTITLLLTAASSHFTLESMLLLHDQNIVHQFNAYIKEYNKEYETVDEHLERFTIFK